MENQDDSVKRLALALTELVKFVPTNQDQLSNWYDKAHVLGESGLMIDAPHFVWHYLSDADIRMKEPEYAEMQNRRINELIDYLNRGVMPSEGEV